MAGFLFSFQYGSYFNVVIYFLHPMFFSGFFKGSPIPSLYFFLFPYIFIIVFLSWIITTYFPVFHTFLIHYLYFLLFSFIFHWPSSFLHRNIFLFFIFPFSSDFSVFLFCLCSSLLKAQLHIINLLLFFFPSFSVSLLLFFHYQSLVQFLVNPLLL